MVTGPGTLATAEKSYTTIGAFRFDQPERIYIRLETFYSKAMYDAGEQPIGNHETTGSVNNMFGSKGSISMESIYTYVKTLPEWSGAVDVLEDGQVTGLQPPPEEGSPEE